MLCEDVFSTACEMALLDRPISVLLRYIDPLTVHSLYRLTSQQFKMYMFFSYDFGGKMTKSLTVNTGYVCTLITENFKNSHVFKQTRRKCYTT